MILRLLGVQIFHIVKFVHAAILHFCEKNASIDYE